ncbi:MAG TPA: phage holin family protein [Aggregicoccus sp.]|nr:phage holin family protein [Aggregicoccus sp.]
MGTEPTDRGITALVGRMADGFSRLVTQHIALARLELAEDARKMGAGVGRIAAFVPFLLTGYALVCGALAVLLARWTGLPGALALVGLANLVGGGLGIASALRHMRAVRVMDASQEELNRSAAALGTPARGPTEHPEHRDGR